MSRILLALSANRGLPSMSAPPDPLAISMAENTSSIRSLNSRRSDLGAVDSIAPTGGSERTRKACASASHPNSVAEPMTASANWNFISTSEDRPADGGGKEIVDEEMELRLEADNPTR